VNLGVGMNSMGAVGGPSTTGASTIEVSEMFFCLGLLCYWWNINNRCRDLHANAKHE